MNRAGARTVEVFLEALRLGLTSFGGPIAHLGYFERTYVRRLGWLSVDEYASLLALCQMLPGPASSQLGFLIGRHRAGWSGAAAAWIGFTLPSAALMLAFAVLAPNLRAPPAAAALHGLELAAVAVVAQAVVSMAWRLCPDPPRRAIGALAAVVLLVAGGAAAQIAVLLAGALAGAALCKGAKWEMAAAADAPGARAAWSAFALCVVLLLALPLAAAMAGPHSAAAFIDAFYRAGALVFGGGHVVLPMLHDALVPGWLSDDAFLSGYGGAQALPGPLFAIASYLGAMAMPAHAVLAGIVALCALFLPGLLLALAGQRLLGHASRSTRAPALLAGVNAAVVGILAAAWYDPVCTSALHDIGDAGTGLLGLFLLERGRWPPVLVVALCVAIAMLRAGMR
ncbi:MAG TPA: chromate efflux transporter [Dokdonella sp.]